MPHLRFEGLSQVAASAMQQHPLVGFADLEHVAHLVAGQAVHVAQHDHLALTGRLQAEDLSPEMREEFSSIYRRWRSEAD